jgi:glutaredoxin 3
MPNVIMYTTRVCPFCVRAKALLNAKGIEFEERTVELSPDGRQFLIDLSGRHTVPQILINETPIGGFDELAALNRSGELDRILAAST